MGAGIGRLGGLVGTPRRRRRARVILILCLVLGPGLYGWLSRPLAQEAPNLVGPKIVVLADKQNVAAVVNMTLSIGPGHSEQPMVLGRINDVTALAANVATQDAAQNQLFYSGIALGVAAGAVITLFLELIPADPVKPAGDARRAGADAARPPG